MANARFEVGDRVLAHVAGEKRLGIIEMTYEFEGDHRCVVRFEDGTDCVVFEFELAPAMLE
jgi:hypothetical protein